MLIAEITTLPAYIATVVFVTALVMLPLVGIIRMHDTAYKAAEADVNAMNLVLEKRYGATILQPRQVISHVKEHGFQGQIDNVALKLDNGDTILCTLVILSAGSNLDVKAITGTGELSARADRHASVDAATDAERANL